LTESAEGEKSVRKQVSVRDVAREAGVSPATVSYILNDTPGLSFTPETRQRVLAAAEKLHYVANQAAKTLGSGRAEGIVQSKLIGVVIPQTENKRKESHIMFGNPFYGTFLSAVELEARRAGYQLILSGTNPGQSYIDIAKSRTLDGVIILGAYPSDDEAEYKKYKIPAVLVDCYGSGDSFFYSVRTDDRLGGYLATKYLIEQGHHRIAIVTGELKAHGVNSERYQGYLDALCEAGLTPAHDDVFEGLVGYDHGLEVAEELARTRRDITALFASADITAIGLINGLHAAGLRVPEDVSVIGFDDVEYAKMCYPGLTTMRQNIMEKGRQAARLMIEAVQDHSLPREERIIPMELIERGTVKRVDGNQAYAQRPVSVF
jgi:DNA-binding LacI/PurR family transcriptional regulator